MGDGRLLYGVDIGRRGRVEPDDEFLHLLFHILRRHRGELAHVDLGRPDPAGVNGIHISQHPPMYLEDVLAKSYFQLPSRSHRD